MFDITPLSTLSCGAISPDGDLCPADSAAIVESEWPTGYASAIWRCHDHVGPSVEAALRLSPQAVVTVTPLAAMKTRNTTENTGEPSSDAPTGDRPALRLVR
jgi:hypothetical protein